MIVWYEAIASAETGETLGGSTILRDVEQAHGAVVDLIARYPDACRIFVRQHLRNGGFRLVHPLAWKKGEPIPRVSKVSWRTIKRQKGTVQ